MSKASGAWEKNGVCLGQHYILQHKPSTTASSTGPGSGIPEGQVTGHEDKKAYRKQKN